MSCNTQLNQPNAAFTCPSYNISHTDFNNLKKTCERVPKPNVCDAYLTKFQTGSDASKKTTDLLGDGTTKGYVQCLTEQPLSELREKAISMACQITACSTESVGSERGVREKVPDFRCILHRRHPK